MIAESRLYTIYMAHSLLSGRKNNTHEIRIWHKKKTSEWYYNIDVWVNLGYAQHARWKKKWNYFAQKKTSFFLQTVLYKGRWNISFCLGDSLLLLIISFLVWFPSFWKCPWSGFDKLFCANVVREYIIEKKEEFLHPPVRYEKK